MSKDQGLSSFISDKGFRFSLAAVATTYLIFILLMVFSNFIYMVSEGDWSEANPFIRALAQKEIQSSIILSLASCTISAFLSLGIAIPTAYFLKGKRFWGRSLLEAILDIPIVLPPLVIGLSLLILFQFVPESFQKWVVYQVPAIILAQTTVATAFAIATLKSTFEQIDSRREQVAMTLGCTQFQAFHRVVLPEAAPGVISAWTLAWARSLGEFGPLLVFAGATRHKTEVLSTSVYLEMSVGNLEGAVAVSLLMMLLAVIVLVITRVWGRLEMSL